MSPDLGSSTAPTRHGKQQPGEELQLQVNSQSWLGWTKALCGWWSCHSQPLSLFTASSTRGHFIKQISDLMEGNSSFPQEKALSQPCVTALCQGLVGEAPEAATEQAAAAALVCHGQENPWKSPSAGLSCRAGKLFILKHEPQHGLPAYRTAQDTQ